MALIPSLLVDPMSILETLVLCVAACYLLKLVLAEVTNFESNIDGEHSELRQLLFEVGAFISLPKQSLQQQRVLR